MTDLFTPIRDEGASGTLQLNGLLARVHEPGAEQQFTLRHSDGRVLPFGFEVASLPKLIGASYESARGRHVFRKGSDSDIPSTDPQSLIEKLDLKLSVGLETQLKWNVSDLRDILEIGLIKHGPKYNITPEELELLQRLTPLIAEELHRVIVRDSKPDQLIHAMHPPILERTITVVLAKGIHEFDNYYLTVARDKLPQRLTRLYLDNDKEAERLEEYSLRLTPSSRRLAKSRSLVNKLPVRIISDLLYSDDKERSGFAPEIRDQARMIIAEACLHYPSREKLYGKRDDMLDYEFFILRNARQIADQVLEIIDAHRVSFGRGENRLRRLWGFLEHALRYTDARLELKEDTGALPRPYADLHDFGNTVNRQANLLAYLLKENGFLSSPKTD